MNKRLLIEFILIGFITSLSGYFFINNTIISYNNSCTIPLYNLDFIIGITILILIISVILFGLILYIKEKEKIGVKNE